MNETETLCNGRWLRLKRRGRWEFAERVNAGGGVIIVAVTPDDRLLLVEQYRAAIEARTIEMPAGLVGDLAHAPDEHAVEAARRELLEETGYLAGRLKSIGNYFTSPGVLSEKMYAFAAYDLEEKTAALEEGEEIELFPVRFSEAIDMIRDGQIHDGKAIATLLMYERFFSHAVK
mgnify:CR=1 FL=1